MGWTSFASPAFATGHIMTQTDMQQITDNLRFLKGTDGAVAIDNRLIATAGGASTDILSALSGGSGNFAGFSVGRAASEARFAIPAATGQFLANAVAGDCIIRNDDNTKKVLLGTGSGNATVAISNTAVGLGTVSPQGILHAVQGAANFLFVNVTGITGVVNVLPAGSVTRVLQGFGGADPGAVSGSNGWSSFNGIAPGPANLLASNLTVGTSTFNIVINANGSVDFNRVTGAQTLHAWGLLIWS